MRGGYIQLLLEMSALLALLIAVWPLLSRRMTAAGRYAICVAVLAGLLLPVRPRLPQGLAVTLPASAPEWVAGALRAPERLAASAANAGTAAVRQGADPWTIAVAVWLAGVLAVALWCAWRYARFLRLLGRRERAEQDAGALDAVREAGEAVGLKRRVRIARSALADTPFVVGPFRPKLVLPEGWPVNAMALKHELTHVRRGDLLLKWLMLLARALNWYNPLVWWFLAIAQTECELSCDEMALKGASEGDRRTYARQILSAASGCRAAGALALGWMGGRNQMKRRLELIVGKGTGRHGYAVLALVLGLMLFAGQWVAAGARVSSHDAHLAHTPGAGDPAKLIYSSGTSYAAMESCADLNGTWLNMGGSGGGPSVVEGYSGAMKTREFTWNLKQVCELKPGWELRALQADHAYTDASGKPALTEIAFAYAVNSDDAHYMTPEEDRAALTPLVEQALAESVKDGLHNTYLAPNLVHDALHEALGDDARMLDGFVYGDGVQFDEEQPVAVSYSQYDIMQIDQLKVAGEQLDMLVGDVGLTRVDDPRELTWDNAKQLIDELIVRYAGERVVVRFANGALLSVDDDNPLGTCTGVIGEYQIILDLNVRLAALTKLGPDAAEAKADEVLQRVIRDEETPDAVKRALPPLLADAFGLTEAQLDGAFTIQTRRLPPE